MSIAKRFFIFLSIELMIAVAVAGFAASWVIRESPAIVQEVGMVEAKIVADFTAIGYEESDYLGWIRPDPLDNVDSRLKIGFYNFGSLERIDCETGYINTQPTSVIYSDMEATVRAMGGSLESQKEEVVRVIDEIRSDKSSRTSGSLENIRWGIESNTYSDGQGGKVRYICFTARAGYEEMAK